MIHNKYFSRIIIIFFFSIPSILYAQSYNSEKSSFVNFVKRYYESSLFEGVKVIEDYENKYLVSILSLDKNKYQNSSIMFRVAKTKSQSQISTFLNGSTISEDFIVKTTETENGNSKSTAVETFQQIKENSIGFVNGIELMSNFENSSGRMIFIYCKEIK